MYVDYETTNTQQPGYASGLHVTYLHSAKVANLWNCQVKSVDAACFEVIVERRVEVEQLRASLASCNISAIQNLSRKTARSMLIVGVTP